MQKEESLLPHLVVENYIRENNKTPNALQIKTILNEFFKFINLVGIKENDIRQITRVNIAQYYYYLRQNYSAEKRNSYAQVVIDFVFYAEQKRIIKRIRWADLWKRCKMFKKE